MISALQTTVEGLYEWQGGLPEDLAFLREDGEAMRRSFQDAMREAQVADVVVRSISGHLTAQMQQHYSTARGHEQESAIARIIDLTRLTQRVRNGNGSQVDSKVDSTDGQHKTTG